MARVKKYGGTTGSNLTVNLSENIIIDGRDYGCKSAWTIPNITDVSRRIVTVAGGVADQVLLSFGSAIAAGTFIAADVKYIRISNLDDTNECHIILKNAANDETAVVLDKGQSFIYNGMLNQNEGVASTLEANAGAVTVSSGGVSNLGNLTDISVCTTASEVDVEVYVASV
tara:strand:- start:760 stop:1272 length:513 start_codon:yes stop_codon:yes gene_type:complete